MHTMQAFVNLCTPMQLIMLFLGQWERHSRFDKSIPTSVSTRLLFSVLKIRLSTTALENHGPLLMRSTISVYIESCLLLSPQSEVPSFATILWP